MEWENPLQTFLLFILFIYTTLYIDAEYAFCCPIFIILTLFTKSYIDRKTGKFQKYWIENEYSSPTNNEKHEPIAIMRLAVVGFRNIPSLLPIDSDQDPRSLKESAVAFRGQNQKKEDDSLPILKKNNNSRTNLEQINGSSHGEGERNERSDGDASTDTHLSKSNSSTPRNDLNRKSASLPFVKVTYQPMSCTDIERIESRSQEGNKEGEGVDEEDLGINDDYMEEYERDVVKEKERKNKGKKDEKEKLDSKKRELIVGCLCLQRKTRAAVNENSFSQLVASLSLGLSRAENQTSDSVLQNILDPWIRGGKANNDRNNNNSGNNNNGGSHYDNDDSNYNDDNKNNNNNGDYNKYNYKDENYNNNHNNNDSPSKPYFPHTQYKVEEEKKNRLRQNSRNSTSNLRFLSSSDIRKNEDPEQQIDLSLLYPILQPQTKIFISPKSTSQSSDINNSKNQKNQKNQKLNRKKKIKIKGPYFLPWDRNEGTLKLSMFVDDPSSFLGSPWGFAKIHVKDFLPGDGINTKGTCERMINSMCQSILCSK